MPDAEGSRKGAWFLSKLKTSTGARSLLDILPSLQSFGRSKTQSHELVILHGYRIDENFFYTAGDNLIY